MKIDSVELSMRIKQEALTLGFSACGIAAPDYLKDDASHLTEWLSQGMHAGMHYMQNHFEKRTDPRQLMPNAKSIIAVLFNYFPHSNLDEDNSLIISKYAYGKDYHTVVKERLRSLQLFIKEKVPQSMMRIFVDSAPVLERAWAALAGLGWIGKNTSLISPEYGSFLFIGEIITDFELEYDVPGKDHCGKCTKCLKACPTNAIVSPRKIDSNRCISYCTIENKGPISENLRGKFNNRIFGCDICQDVCPWNHMAIPQNIPELQPSSDLIAMTCNDWQNLTEEKYKELFHNSAVKRAKYTSFKRNIDFILDKQP
jgi:epoxyqueuosine reductase